MQLYALTPWGARLDDLLLALCRWALESPDRDLSLFLSPAAMMMSLRAVFDPALAAGVALSAVMRIGREAFSVRIDAGRITILRGAGDQADCTISGPDTLTIRRLIYGKASAAALAAGGLAISGDAAAVERFVGLFHLPPQWA